jgi:PhnB protein
MPTLPYIHFQGTCAEALTFYAKVFGGTDLQMMRFAEGPGAPPHWADSPRIMHGQVTIDDGTFMASDYPPGTDGDSQQGFSVMQSAKDVQTAKARFDALADGGTILDDFKPTFFPPASV